MKQSQSQDADSISKYRENRPLTLLYHQIDRLGLTFQPPSEIITSPYQYIAKCINDVMRLLSEDNVDRGLRTRLAFLSIRITWKYVNPL